MRGHNVWFYGAIRKIIPKLSGQWVGDNERLCAMELYDRKGPRLKSGSNPEPLDQQAST